MRWAVLGTGYVSRKFVLGLRALGRLPEVTVVASRDIDRARRFAADFNVATATCDYEAAVASADVDVVYVATPPSVHCAHALLAIAHGKAVLVEKPFAMNGAEARRIAEAARAGGVFCMEAMWSRFQPLTQAIKSRLANGELGELRGFHGSFFGASLPDPSVSLFQPEKGGGALMGRGVYPVSLARYFLGRVVNVESSAWIGETGVDEECALLLTHESGALSTIRASVRTNGRNDGHVFGTGGTIWIREPIYRPFSAEISHTVVRGGGDSGGGRLERIKEGGMAQGMQQRAHGLVRWLRSARLNNLNAYYAGNGYHYEAEAVMRAIGEGKTESLVMPLDESIEVMDVIDAARSSWVTGVGGGGEA